MFKIASIIALTIPLSLAACSAPASIADSEAQVSRFHQQLDAERYEEIWNASAKDMKQATSKAELGKFLAAVHRKLGKVKASKQTGWRSNSTTDGAFTQLAMATTFERGTGQESFTFRTVAGHPTLVGYNLNSNDMMLN